MKSPPRNQTEYLQREKIKRYTILSIRFLLLIMFLIIWEFATRFDIIDGFIFSSPSKVALAFVNLLKDGTLITHITTTLTETIVSFSLVILFSILVSVFLWFFSSLSKVLDPYLVIMNSLPKSALAPLLIVWLGANSLTIIVAGISVAIFGSVLSLHSVFQQVDPNKIKLIYALGGKKYHALFKVVLPSSIPSLFNIMKVNIGLCLVGVIIGEFLAARNGLGYLIIYSSQVFKMDWLLLSIVLLCIMAMLLYAIINIFERVYNTTKGNL